MPSSSLHTTPPRQDHRASSSARHRRLLCLFGALTVAIAAIVVVGLSGSPTRHGAPDTASSLTHRRISVVEEGNNLALDPGTLSLGPVGPDATVRATVTLVNRTPRTIRLVDVISGCGCTTAGLTNAPIPPNGAAMMTIATKAPAVAGATSRRSLRLISHSHRSPLRLLVECTTQSHFSSLVFYPVEASAPLVTISSTDGPPFAIASIDPNIFAGLPTHSSPSHTLTVRPHRYSAHNRPSTIRLSLIDSPHTSTTLDIEGLRSHIQTPPPRPASVTPRPNRDIRTRLHVSPRRLDFGLIPRGGAETRAVVIHDATEPSTPLIPHFRSTSGRISVISATPVQDGLRLRLRLDTDPKARGYVAGQLRLDLGTQYTVLDIRGRIADHSTDLTSGVSE